MHTAPGFAPAQAPEILMGDRCTEKVDMFSYGVILWELITGEAPARGRLRTVKCAGHQTLLLQGRLGCVNNRLSTRNLRQ